MQHLKHKISKLRDAHKAHAASHSALEAAIQDVTNHAEPDADDMAPGAMNPRQVVPQLGAAGGPAPRAVEPDADDMTRKWRGR